jgi:hypothetical protein
VLQACMIAAGRTSAEDAQEALAYQPADEYEPAPLVEPAR